jgi:hypothetical protein
MRSRVVAVVVVAIVAVGSLAAWRWSRPDLRFTSATPDDLREVATDAWHRFAAAFPARAGCLDGLTVGVGWELRDRARYEPSRALVLIRAPGTEANLEASLLHEFAHHVEHVCPPSAAFRERFVAAGDLPAGTPWRGGDRWDAIPSERFAEAAVIRVLGGPPPHILIHVHPAEVAMVSAWAGDG